MTADARKWDAIHSRPCSDAAEPATVLRQNAHLLPAQGTALDLACGRGGNALFLASRGLETCAWDISAVAIAALAEHAQRAGLPLRASVRDVVAEPPAPGGFDVVVVSRFLERSIAPAIAAALRPGGLLFYQTFVAAALSVSDTGPRNPAYRLGRNELLRLFPTLTVRVYREEGRAGDLAQGLRDEALLVAEAPA